MDLVLVLNLTFLLIRQSLTDVAPQQTHGPAVCPPGSRKKEQSEDGAIKCEECKDGEYTEVNNTDTECQRCSTECPGHLETIVKNCTTTSNIKCGCKEGTYYSGGGICTRCSTNEGCQRIECLNHEKYKKKCMTTTLSPTTTTTNTTVPKPKTRSSNPSVTQVTPAQVSHVPLVIFGMTGVMVFCVMAYLIKNLLRYQSLSPCCCAEKDVESNAEHQSDQNSSPTTLIISNCDGTPVITLSPFSPEHPAHVSPLLPPPASEHKVAREEEQSEHWPAIVLYTIIKEVPLRRWKEFLRLLSVADHQLERVELEAGLGSIERQYQMLRLWSQRPSASLDDIFSALCYMDLPGCAQLLMESLEKLQWRNEQKQGVAAHRGYTDHQDVKTSEHSWKYWK